MKKFFIMAIAALAMIACNSNDPNGPSSKEQKAMKLAASGAVDMLGKDQASVEKQLTAAGFVKMDDAVKLPMKRQPLRKVKGQKAEGASVTYIYPAEAVEMGEDAMPKFMTDGNTVVGATVMYNEDGKMVAIETISYVGAAQPKSSFINLSNALYDKIPSGSIGNQTSFPMAMWKGYFSDNMEVEPVEVEDHATLIAKVKAADMVISEEGAQVVKSYSEEAIDGFVYSAAFVVPDEEAKAEMVKEVGFAYAYAMTYVADMDAL